MRFSTFFCSVFLFYPALLEARVFNIARENIAPYFSFSGGGVQTATAAFDGEAGSNITYSGTLNYNYTIEVGALYSHEAVSLRLGFEAMKPFALTSIGNDGTSDLYTATSEIMGYMPKVALELTLNSDQTTRSIFSIYGGAASLSMKNSYLLTAAGQAAFPGVSDHGIDTKASATLAGASLGVEGLFTDTTTLLFEFGYRQLIFNNFTYTNDVTTFTGTKAAGDKVVKISGVDRALDFTGVFVSIGFRFYF